MKLVIRHFYLILFCLILGLGSSNAQGCFGSTSNCNSQNNFAMFPLGNNTVSFIAIASNTGLWDYGDGSPLVVNQGGGVHTYANCGTYDVRYCVNGQVCIQQLVISGCAPACTVTAGFAAVPGTYRQSYLGGGFWANYQDYRAAPINVDPNLNCTYNWTASYEDQSGSISQQTRQGIQVEFPIMKWEQQGANISCFRWIVDLKLEIECSGFVNGSWVSCSDETIQYGNGCNSGGIGTFTGKEIERNEASVISFNEEGDLDHLSPEIKVYPTVIQSGNTLNIEIPYSLEEIGLTNVRLTDINGRLVKEVQLRSGRSDFSTVGLGSGVYVLTFDLGNGTLIPKRIIVQ